MKTPTLHEPKRVALDKLVKAAWNYKGEDAAMTAALVENLRRNGQVENLVVRELGAGRFEIVNGNHRYDALVAIGAKSAIVVNVGAISEQHAKRLAVELNETRFPSDVDRLAAVLREIATTYPDDLVSLPFSAGTLDDVLAGGVPPMPVWAEPAQAPASDPVDQTAAEVLPPTPRVVTVRTGELWALGAHRLLCGDTTDPAAVARLVAGLDPIAMLHADPPYGMGKEADGIANDNLRGDALDAFQVAWLRAWWPSLAGNGSLYVWGNASDLWRLWYRGGLDGDEFELLWRNEIVWDKGVASAGGVSLEGADGLHSYPTATERCLFLMRGQQFLGSQNKDDYWQGYEPLRLWLVNERERAGWSNSHVNKITASHMAGHWFTKSQFMPISREQYDKLQAAAAGRAFVEHYDDVFERVFGAVRRGGNQHRRGLAEKMRSERSHYDNTHDQMNDVWKFPRVVGADRFGHATPKPVAMAQRAIKSSAPAGAVVGVPFAGTGPEFIAAEQAGRRCVGIDISAEYCQAVIDRWEAFTGKKAERM